MIAPRFAGVTVPGDGVVATWSYRTGAGRAEAFLLNPHPQTAHIEFSVRLPGFRKEAVDVFRLRNISLNSNRVPDGPLKPTRLLA